MVLEGTQDKSNTFSYKLSIIKYTCNWNQFTDFGNRFLGMSVSFLKNTCKKPFSTSLFQVPVQTIFPTNPVYSEIDISYQPVICFLNLFSVIQMFILSSESYILCITYLWFTIFDYYQHKYVFTWLRKKMLNMECRIMIRIKIAYSLSIF